MTPFINIGKTFMHRYILFYLTMMEFLIFVWCKHIYHQYVLCLETLLSFLLKKEGHSKIELTLNHKF